MRTVAVEVDRVRSRFSRWVVVNSSEAYSSVVPRLQGDRQTTVDAVASSAARTGASGNAHSSAVARARRNGMKSLAESKRRGILLDRRGLTPAGPRPAAIAPRTGALGHAQYGDGRPRPRKVR